MWQCWKKHAMLLGLPCWEKAGTLDSISSSTRRQPLSECEPETSGEPEAKNPWKHLCCWVVQNLCANRYRGWSCWFLDLESQSCYTATLHTVTQLAPCVRSQHVATPALCKFEADKELTTDWPWKKGFLFHASAFWTHRSFQAGDFAAACDLLPQVSSFELSSVKVPFGPVGKEDSWIEITSPQCG